MRYEKNGFTLLEALLSVFIFLLVITLSFNILKIMQKSLHIDSSFQNQFAIIQIRQILAVSKIQSCTNSQLNYRYNNKDFVLKKDKKRIVITPGYEIMMDNIQDAVFINEEGKYYLEMGEKKIQLY